MKAARLDAMEQYILQNGQVSIQQLLRHFDISINTLRRDLDALEARGHISKIYGGAAAQTLNTFTPMPERFRRNVPAKRRIGELAAALIPEDTTVFIDSGSTVPHIVRFLDGRRGLTIVSHSLPVLNEASRLREVNTISLGGIYNASVGAFVGISAYEAIRSLSIKIAVMAATGVSLRHGLSNTTYFEADIKRIVTSNCEKIVLLADHTKFDVEALLTYCPLEHVNAVVTDLRPSSEYVDFFADHGIRLLYSDD